MPNVRTGVLGSAVLAASLCCGILFPSARVLGADAKPAPAAAGSVDRLEGVDRKARDEVRRLMIDVDAGERDASVSNAAELRANCPLVIEPFPIEPYSEVKKAPVPASFRPVTIGPDGNFLREGRPVFLLGADASVFLCPQQTRALGFDFVQVHSFYDDASSRSERTDKGFRLYRKPFRWVETQMAMLTERGLLTYIAGNEGNIRKKILRNLPKNSLLARRPDLLVEAGHFIKFRHENPEARQLRFEFWKSVLHSTRKHPVFALELFNELGYTDYAPESIARFRRLMQDKYGDIETANRMWKTAFPDFAGVEPPRQRAFALGVRELLPEGASDELFRDYARFMELRCAEIIADLVAFIRRHDPNTFLTVQSHVQLKFDYGAQGVNPLRKVEHEDFYGDERGVGVLHEERDADNQADILDCFKTILAFDVIRAASPNKPILNAESPPKGGYSTTAPGDRVIDLAGTWRFMPDNEVKGVAAGYPRPDFDDSQWRELRVPGTWANQGFPGCRLGWCRRRFVVPQDCAGPFFLNGGAVADSARVFIDGEEVTRVRPRTPCFSVEVTARVRPGQEQTIALMINCRAAKGGFHPGGLKGGLSLDRARAGVPVPMNAQGMRTCLWTMAMHGQCAVNISYSGVPEGWRISLFNPDRVAADGIRMIPRVKREIDSVADIVLPRPRIKARLALYYPLEAFRAYIPENMARRVSAPLNSDLMRLYGALLVSGHPFDFVFSKDLTSGGLRQYAALFVKNATRVSKGCVAGLRAYVEQGGVLITDGDSFRITDEFCEPIDFARLTGCERGVALQAGACDLSALGGAPDVAFAPRRRDGGLGVSLTPVAATPLVARGGQALATTCDVGRGKTIVVGCELDLAAWRAVVRHVAEVRLGQAEPVRVRDAATSARPTYVESHLFEREGDVVVVLTNWGAARSVTVAVPGIPDGDYVVRDVERREIVGVFSHAVLREKGLSLRLASRAPGVLLLERGGKPLRALDDAPARDRELLDVLYRNVDAGEKAKRLLFTANHLDTASPVRVPEAVSILKSRGFQVDVLLKWAEGEDEFRILRGSQPTTATLEEYGLVVLGAPRIGVGPKEWETRKYLAYVEKGGALLMGFTQHEGPHSWYAPWRAKQHFGELMGFDVRKNLTTDKPALYDEPGFVRIVPPPSEHPILQGVKAFQTFGGLVLELHDPAWRTVLKAGDAASDPEGAVIAERALGKGRVVLVGGMYWWTFLDEEHDDNRQLFSNLFAYLTGEPAVTE